MSYAQPVSKDQTAQAAKDRAIILAYVDFITLIYENTAVTEEILKVTTQVLMRGESIK